MPDRPAAPHSVLIHPAMLDEIHRALGRIYETTGHKPIVSIGLQPGNLVGGTPCTIRTPAGPVMLFEDDGQ